VKVSAPVRLLIAAPAGPAGFAGILALADGAGDVVAVPLGLWVLGLAFWAARAGRSPGWAIAVFVAALVVIAVASVATLYVVLSMTCGNDCFS
jgi:hypothetical protein